MKMNLKRIACLMAAVMMMLGAVPKIDAALAPSDLAAIGNAHQRPADLETVRKTLETKMVRERLEALGFTQAEIQSRIEAMSDQDLHQLALNLDKLNVGGDGLGIVIAVLVIAILVVILFQISGHKIIIK